MNLNIMNVADLKPEGSDKTYRQLNMEKTHLIPLGALVEVLEYNWKEDKYERSPFGLRLYVVRHGRDCDGEPLYWLSAQTLKDYNIDMEFMKNSIVIADGHRLPGKLFGPKTYGGCIERRLLVLHINPPTRD